MHHDEVMGRCPLCGGIVISGCDQPHPDHHRPDPTCLNGKCGYDRERDGDPRPIRKAAAQ